MDTMLSKEQRIIEAAELVFAKHGYEKATVDEIIALADVGKGTVYKYFGNKEGLFYNLVCKKNALFVERLDAAVAHGKDLEHKLLAFFTEMITFYKAHAALWQIICFEMLGNSSGCMVKNVNGVPTVVSRYEVDLDEEKKEQMIRYHLLLESEFNILQQVLQEAMDEGKIKSTDVELMTMYIFFGVAMCIFHPHDVVEATTPAEMAWETVEHMLQGIAL